MVLETGRYCTLRLKWVRTNSLGHEPIIKTTTTNQRKMGICSKVFEDPKFTELFLFISSPDDLEMPSHKVPPAIL